MMRHRELSSSSLDDVATLPLEIAPPQPTPRRRLRRSIHELSWIQDDVRSLEESLRLSQAENEEAGEIWLNTINSDTTTNQQSKITPPHQRRLFLAMILAAALLRLR